MKLQMESSGGELESRRVLPTSLRSSCEGRGLDVCKLKASLSDLRCPLVAFAPDCPPPRQPEHHNRKEMSRRGEAPLRAFHGICKHARPGRSDRAGRKHHNKDEDDASCVVCFENVARDTREHFPCSHWLCSTCFLKLSTCPVCRVDKDGLTQQDREKQQQADREWRELADMEMVQGVRVAFGLARRAQAILDAPDRELRSGHRSAVVRRLQASDRFLRQAEELLRELSAFSSEGAQGGE